MTDSDVREQVRQRYAAAAVAVAATGANALAIVDAGTPAANESCCGGGEVDDASKDYPPPGVIKKGGRP